MACRRAAARVVDGEAGWSGVSAAEVLAELNARIDTIEEAYEFFLAYASQGLQSDAQSSHPIRDHLKRFDDALSGIRDFFDSCVVRLGLDAGRAAAARSFIAVLESEEGTPRNE